MIESISKVFKNYTKFSGRSNRAEYWWFFLFAVLMNIGLDLIQLYTGITFLTLIWALAILVPSIAVGVRRMHDVGRSGLYLLIPIYSLVLLCTKGDYGANPYGSDPNEMGEAFDFESNRFHA